MLRDMRDRQDLAKRVRRWLPLLVSAAFTLAVLASPGMAAASAMDDYVVRVVEHGHAAGAGTIVAPERRWPAPFKRRGPVTEGYVVRLDGLGNVLGPGTSVEAGDRIGFALSAGWVTRWRPSIEDARAG